ncbi:MAG: oligosaccharide repeat unit polymerase [Bacilli bacterium]|nr:oligosaccharide repeat unit polymerase [Bacilli bacterium]
MIWLIAYILEIIILTFVERRCWCTYITPLTCLMIPGGIIILLAIIISYISNNYIQFYLPSLQIWMIGYFLFALPSWILSPYNKQTYIKEKKINPVYQFYNKEIKIICINRKREEKMYKILVVVAFLLLIFMFLKMRSLHGSVSWGSDEYSESYTAGGGLRSHLNVLLTTIFIYMFCKADKNHKLAWVICGLSLINMFAVGVKSWIIGPCIIGYISRVNAKKSVLKISVLIIMGIFVCLIFALSYFILMVMTGKSELGSDFYNFLFDHFIGYLIGPSLSFSLDFQQGIMESYMPLALIAPIINFFHVIVGDPLINPINSVWVEYGISSGNVRTFLGTVYAYSNGTFLFAIIVILYSLYFYLIQYLASTNRNFFLILISSTNMGFLILGFFEFYWLNLAPFEIVMILFILGFITRYLPVTNERNL